MSMNTKKLYKHQQVFINRNPNKALLVWETGTGKTIACAEWIKKRVGMRVLIACPKAIISKWKADLIEWDVDVNYVDVCSRDEIKKKDLNVYDVLVLDEAHDYSSALFGKGRSDRTFTVYNYVKNNPTAPILLLTATPVRSTPENIHTLACFLGIYWDIKKFKEEFFYLTNTFGRLHYEKKVGWQKKIRPYVESISDVVLMRDCVDVPVQSEKIVIVPWVKADEESLPKGGTWVERHRAENDLKKFKVLESILNGYRKAIVVCHYVAQLEEYARLIGKDRQVFVLQGSTKEQGEVIREACEADDCVFLVQAQMGAGFDASEFSVVIFASLSFRYVDMIQMKGRVKRINNLHENMFIYLLGGRCDNSVYETIKAGNDFNPHVYLAKVTKSYKEA